MGVLKDLKHLRGVVLPYAAKYDLSVLLELPDLKFVTVADNGQPFDYGCLPGLIDLRIQWHPKVKLPDASRGLEALYLRGYKPREGNLSGIPQYRTLQALELVQGTTASLEGAERWNSLRSCECHYLLKLRHVSALKHTNIEMAQFDNCKKIEDVELLSAAPELRVLRFTDCGSLRSLGFFKKFRKVEEFRFVGTDVLDGEMSPLLSLRRVGFLSKKHFSHTPEQIEAKLLDKTAAMPG